MKEFQQTDILEEDMKKNNKGMLTNLKTVKSIIDNENFSEVEDYDFQMIELEKPSIGQIDSLKTTSSKYNINKWSILIIFYYKNSSTFIKAGERGSFIIGRYLMFRGMNQQPQKKGMNFNILEDGSWIFLIGKMSLKYYKQAIIYKNTMSNSMLPKLVYYKIRGLCQPIRHLLYFIQVDFEDKKIERDISDTSEQL